MVLMPSRGPASESHETLPHPLPRKIVIQLLEAFHDGSSLADLARLPNDWGTPTPYGGKRWKPATVARTVIRPHYRDYFKPLEEPEEKPRRPDYRGVDTRYGNSSVDIRRKRE
jgi:hypothetical protein